MDSYETHVRRTLKTLGSDDPAEDVKSVNGYLEACQAAGISADVAAATIYSTVRHKHHPDDGTTLRELAASEETLHWKERWGGSWSASGMGGTYHLYPRASGGYDAEFAQRGAAATKLGSHSTLGAAMAAARRHSDDTGKSEKAAEDSASGYFESDPQRLHRINDYLDYGYEDVNACLRASADVIRDIAAAPTKRGTYYRAVPATKAMRAQIRDGVVKSDSPWFVTSDEKIAAKLPEHFGGKDSILFTIDGDAVSVEHLGRKRKGESIIPALQTFNVIGRRNGYHQVDLRQIGFGVREEGDPSAMGAESSRGDGAGESIKPSAEPTCDVACIPMARVTRSASEHEAFLPTSKRIGAVSSPKRLYEVLSPTMLKEAQEIFVVVALNLRGEMVCPPIEVARGQRSRVNVDAEDVMRAVLASGGEGFAVAHSHPTGSAKPSSADRKLTANIKEACKPFKGIKYCDHIVIGTKQYFSIEQNKLYKA